MFKKLSLVLFILSFSIFAFAQDDQGNPNNPNDNERANACYEGGSMEGKCLTDWDWEAGWYIIRFDAGLISREDFPAQYAVLLPPLADDDNAPTGAGCQPVLGAYVDFGNSNYVPATVPTYSDANCATPTGMTTGMVPFVWTSTLVSAASICFSHGHPNSAGTVNPGQLYHCN